MYQQLMPQKRSAFRVTTLPGYVNGKKWWVAKLVLIGM